MAFAERVPMHPAPVEPKRNEVEILLPQSLSQPWSKTSKMKNRQEGAGLLKTGRHTLTYIRSSFFLFGPPGGRQELSGANQEPPVFRSLSVASQNSRRVRIHPTRRFGLGLAQKKTTKEKKKTGECNENY